MICTYRGDDTDARDQSTGLECRSVCTDALVGLWLFCTYRGAERSVALAVRIAVASSAVLANTAFSGVRMDRHSTDHCEMLHAQMPVGKVVI